MVDLSHTVLQSRNVLLDRICGLGVKFGAAKVDITMVVDSFGLQRLIANVSMP